MPRLLHRRVGMLPSASDGPLRHKAFGNASHMSNLSQSSQFPDGGTPALMHHHRAGSPCASARRPWPRLGGAQRYLPIAGVVLIAASAIALQTPTQPETVHRAPVRHVVAAAAYGPLNHDSGSGPVMPVQQDDRVAPEASASSAADDQPVSAADREVLHKVKQA